MKKDVARNYLEVSVESSSPLKLVVWLYDIAIEALKAASVALEAGDAEKRTHQVNRAMTAIGELQGALDFENGGEVATQLARLYTHSRRKLYEAHSQASPEALAELTGELESVRDAWKQVERSVDGTQPANKINGNIPAGPPIDGSGRDWSA